MTPKECAELFDEQGGMQPSTSSLDRLPKILSKQWERKRAEFEATLRCSEELVEEAVSLAVSIDGVQALMKDEGRAEKRSQEDKRPMGPAGFRKWGVRRCPCWELKAENLQTIRYARMPQQGKRDVKE